MLDQMSEILTNSSGGGKLLLIKMAFCKGMVLVREASTAGIAESEAWRMPKPPSHIGSEACLQLVSVKRALTTDARASRCNPSKRAISGCSTSSEHLRRCWILGAPKEDRNRIKASCEAILPSLGMALAISLHLSFHASFNVCPVKR